MAGADPRRGGEVVAPGEASTAMLFERPAEVVELSERLYIRLFAVGLWVAVGCTAYGLLDSALQPTGSLVRGIVVCGAWLPLTIAAASYPARLYRFVRRHPSAVLAPAVALGAGAIAVGPHNFQLFAPVAASIAAIGIAAPLRVVLGAAVIGAVGLGAPKLIEAQGAVAEAAVVIVPPVMLWLIVEHVAQFSLGLPRRLQDDEALPRAPAVAGREPGPGAGGDGARPPGPFGLPVPRVVEIGSVRLTSRQLQVVLLVCEGLRLVEIGAVLGIAPQQVGRHLGEAQRRTGSRSTPQLAAWALTNALVTRPPSAAG